MYDVWIHPSEYSGNWKVWCLLASSKYYISGGLPWVRGKSNVNWDKTKLTHFAHTPEICWQLFVCSCSVYTSMCILDLFFPLVLREDSFWKLKSIVFISVSGTQITLQDTEIKIYWKYKCPSKQWANMHNMAKWNSAINWITYICAFHFKCLMKMPLS